MREISPAAASWARAVGAARSSPSPGSFLPNSATRRGGHVDLVRRWWTTGRGRGGVPSIVFRRPFLRPLTCRGDGVPSGASFCGLALALLQEAYARPRLGQSMRCAGAQVRASLCCPKTGWASAPSLAHNCRPAPSQPNDLVYRHTSLSLSLTQPTSSVSERVPTRPALIGKLRRVGVTHGSMCVS